VAEADDVVEEVHGGTSGSLVVEVERSVACGERQILDARGCLRVSCRLRSAGGSPRRSDQVPTFWPEKTEPDPNWGTGSWLIFLPRPRAFMSGVRSGMA